jgi:predicted DNA-binding protein with PD1-like motif
VKTTLLDYQGPMTNLLVYDPDKVVRGILVGFVKEKSITDGHVTAIGAVSRAVLGFFDRKTNYYKRVPQNGQDEVLSLIGDVALKEDGAPGVHARNSRVA